MVEGATAASWAVRRWLSTSSTLMHRTMVRFGRFFNLKSPKSPVTSLWTSVTPAVERSVRGSAEHTKIETSTDPGWPTRGVAGVDLGPAGARRVPLYGALAAVGFVGAPVWLLTAAAADRFFGGGRPWPRTRALGFFGLYLACEVMGVVLATLFWLATLGGRLGGPSRYRAANAALQRWWTAALFEGAVRLFSMKVHVEGLELARSGPLLLFVRHASTADTVLAAALVANPHRLSLRYVLKRELLWDPCLDDIVGRQLPERVRQWRRGSRSRAEMNAVARLAVDLDPWSGVLIFPEGTRFTTEKLARALETLRERKQERLAAIAWFPLRVAPQARRTPGLARRGARRRCAPAEHTGFEGAATFGRFWSGDLVGKSLRVRLRRFAAGTIPATGRDESAVERWAEMDDWLAPTPPPAAQTRP